MLSFSACDHHWHLISICPMQAIWPPEGPVYLWRGVGWIRKCDTLRSAKEPQLVTYWGAGHWDLFSLIAPNSNLPKGV